MSGRDSWMISGRVPAIKAVMTPFPYSLEVAATAAQARELMAANEFSHLPVQDAHHPVGMVTRHELERADSAARLGDIMHRGIFVVDMDQPLDQVLSYMAAHHVHSTLVVRDGRLAGIFTASDACRLLGEKLAILAGRSEPDQIA